MSRIARIRTKHPAAPRFGFSAIDSGPLAGGRERVREGRLAPVNVAGVCDLVLLGSFRMIMRRVVVSLCTVSLCSVFPVGNYCF